METILGKLPWLALFGALTSCGPRVGQVVSAPPSAEASAFLGDLAVAEGDVVLISRRYCKSAYKPMVRDCHTTPVETGRVVRIEQTPKGRYALVAVPSTSQVRSGDFVTSTF
jgi:hypothetical protein